MRYGRNGILCKAVFFDLLELSPSALKIGSYDRREVDEI